MLAGVCGADFVMLVVAADDGVMPQTVEHLHIVELLGIARGVAVITKIDRVPDERVAEVEASVRALLAPTRLADCAMVHASATTGVGIDALKAMLAAHAQAGAAAVAKRRFRYVVDRVFTTVGSGTVVTGTVFDGEIEVGARLLLSPAALEVRVCGIQKHGQKHVQAAAGERCALNLSGVEVSQVSRGQWVLDPALDAPTGKLDVRLTVLATEKHALKHWMSCHLHIGTEDRGAGSAGPAACHAADRRCADAVPAAGNAARGDRPAADAARRARALAARRQVDDRRAFCGHHCSAASRYAAKRLFVCGSRIPGPWHTYILYVELTNQATTMARFTDKVFLISGGARGLGGAQARQLVAEGGRVVVGDVLMDQGRRLAEELGERCRFQPLDVTSEAQWSDAVVVAESMGRLHGLVNNAAVYKPVPLLDTDTAEFERHIRVNQLARSSACAPSCPRWSVRPVALLSTFRLRWRCAACRTLSLIRRPNGQFAA